MTDPTEESQNANRLLKGGIWAIAARWNVKFLGLISTLFIVRLLAPQDFGIVTKAMVIISPITVIVNIGFSETLLRIRNPDKSHYDTAFTANAIIALCASIILLCITPLCAWIFQEDLLNILLPLLSIKILMSGFINPRIKDFLREFQYTKDFTYLIVSKVITIMCVISACYYYKNYNGLIVGQIGGIFGTLIISYYLIPYKPRFSIAHIKEFADFSLPNIRAGFGDDILMNLDRILLARYLTNTPLGFYNLACELAEQFTTEVIYPLSRGFFPVFADLEHDKEALRTTYLGGLGFLIPFCLAIGAGLSLIAEPLITAYAGEKWLPTVPMLSLLALSAAAQAFCLVNASVMGATGWIKIRARLTNSNAIISSILMLPFAVKGDIDNVLLVKLCVSTCFVFINLYYVSKILMISYQDTLKAMIRPIIATIVMWHILSYIEIDYALYELITMFFVGAISFVTTQFLLWFLVGQPASIERTILNKIICINKHLNN